MKLHAWRPSASASRAVFLLCALLATVPSAFSSPARQAQPASVRILVPLTTAAVPFLALAREEPLKGIDIKVETFLDHQQALALLLRGEAELLCTGTSQGWENRLGGSPIVIVDTGVWGVSSLIGLDRAIRSPADLRGKRVGLPFPGSPLDVQTRYLLQRSGVDPDRDLTISYGSFTQIEALLVAGKLDAVALPEPMASMAIKTNGLLRLFEYAEAWGAATGGDRRTPQVSLFATESWAKAHGTLLIAIVDAWRAASEQVSKDPSSAERYASVLQADPGVLEEAVRHTLYEVPAFPEHQARLLAYYNETLRLLPGEKRPLDGGFFFTP